jgi:hypothetical protein
MMKASNEKLNKIIITSINIFLFIFMVTINALANILPINGKNTGELSDKYPNLFVPAGITFSIWGLIYLLLLFFIVYNFYSVIVNKNKITLKLNEYIVFGVTCLLNSFWILTWHYELIALSVIIMITLLLSLIYLFIKVDILKIKGIIEKISIKIPISLYLGWISVATIANITALLIDYKWKGFGISENIWTIILIIIGAFLAILMLLIRKNISYALVIVWAYLGIIIKRSSQTIVFYDIIYTCYIAIFIIIILIIITAIKKLNNKIE